MSVARSPVRRAAGGRFELHLSRGEREALRTVPPQIRELLEAESPASDSGVARLFPPAYPDDPLRNLEFERLAADELMQGRLSALGTMESTIDATSLSEDELLAWMHVVNDARLILGTRLDVTEETAEDDFADEPEATSFQLYSYLSWLLDSIVRALRP